MCTFFSLSLFFSSSVSRFVAVVAALVLHIVYTQATEIEDIIPPTKRWYGANMFECRTHADFGVCMVWQVRDGWLNSTALWFVCVLPYLHPICLCVSLCVCTARHSAVRRQYVEWTKQCATLAKNRVCLLGADRMTVWQMRVCMSYGRGSDRINYMTYMYMQLVTI